MDTPMQQQPGCVLPPLKKLHLAAITCDVMHVGMLVQAL